MILSIKDRLNFGQLYPEKSNLLQAILVKDINEKVQLTQEEATEIELKPAEGNRVVWNPEKAKDKEVTFTEAELNLLKEQVKALDEKKEINQSNLELCLLISK